MRKSETMLTLEQVLELSPGNDEQATWINPGFTGVIRKSTRIDKGKTRWAIVVASTTGSATIETAFFTAPKFMEGDLVEFSGKGLRRTEYNGKPQFAVGRDTEVHVLSKGTAGASPAPAAALVERSMEPQPKVNGTIQPINGQTVGMAMKEAITLAVMDGGTPDTSSPAFWELVHRNASNIIRLSRHLERGNLTPAMTSMAGGNASPGPSGAPGVPPATPKASEAPAGAANGAGRGAKPTPGPEGAAFTPAPGDGEDVPF